MAGKTPSVKERRTRILLTLYLLDKSRAHHIFDPIVIHVFSLPAETPRSRGTIRQMLSDGVIRKEDNGTYRLTDEGVLELALSFPFVRYQTEPWDGVYRILSYEIPESKRAYRDSLRREVSGWGLGPWHRSFWVTPHPVAGVLNELIAGTDLAKYVQMFEGKPVIGDTAVLVEKVWETPKLENNYKGLFRKWHETLSGTEENKHQKLRAIVNEYITVLKEDPGLPPELVGKKWIGSEAFAIFQEMKGILLDS